MAFKFRNYQYSPEKNAQKYLKSIGFTLGKAIGQGTYSKVCIANTTKQKFACKVINKKYAGADFIKKFLPRELKIISKIKHPNIVTVYNILDINNIIYIIMDFCRNGDLLEYIKCNGPFPELTAKMYFKQIASAIEYLHDQDIAHRDLKCENIFLTSTNRVKLGDFGFARWCKNEEGEDIFSATFCGSAAYAAPEVLQGIAYQPKMIDIWAMGCVLYIMLSASMPFDDSNIKKMVKAQQSRVINTFMKFNWYNISPSLKELLSFILEPNCSDRATIKDIRYSAWLLTTIQEDNGKESSSSSSLSMLKVLM